MKLVEHVVAIFRRVAERRDARLWREWERVREAQRQQGGVLYEIVGIRQHASTGTNAYARRVGEAEIEAVWAPGVRLKPGSIMLTTEVFRRGGRAGSHHDEDFLHLKKLETASSVSAYAGWQRHKARQATARDGGI